VAAQERLAVNFRPVYRTKPSTVKKSQCSMVSRHGCHLRHPPWKFTARPNSIKSGSFQGKQHQQFRTKGRSLHAQ